MRTPFANLRRTDLIGVRLVAAMGQMARSLHQFFSTGGARTFLSAATWVVEPLAHIQEPAGHSGVAADKNVRAPFRFISSLQCSCFPLRYFLFAIGDRLLAILVPRALLSSLRF